MSGMFQGDGELTTIYVSSTLVHPSVTQMFNGCVKLQGGAGTVFSEGNVSGTYARIDGGTTSPGYFTAK